ncbi:hypothetical protein OIU77_021652 [Salix suchowensis]|nr:hypothetical protein OIU77_021652 [Salix suchowensis]
MHKSNEIRRVCKWIYSYFIGIVKFFVKMLFYANRAIQSIKPEFWEKNYESRRSLCRKLDVELPAQHSSIPYRLTSLKWSLSMMSEIRRHPDSNVPGGSTDDRGFKNLPTDLCRVNLAGDFCCIQRKVMDLKRAHNFGIDSSSDLVQEHMKTKCCGELPRQGTFCPENPAITVSNFAW